MTPHWHSNEAVHRPMAPVFYQEQQEQPGLWGRVPVAIIPTLTGSGVGRIGPPRSPRTPCLSCLLSRQTASTFTVGTRKRAPAMWLTVFDVQCMFRVIEDVRTRNARPSQSTDEHATPQTYPCPFPLHHEPTRTSTIYSSMLVGIIIIIICMVNL